MLVDLWEKGETFVNNNVSPFPFQGGGSARGLFEEKSQNGLGEPTCLI